VYRRIGFARIRWNAFLGISSAPGHSIVRYAAAVGMIWGIFLGTAVMAFSLLLVTLIHVAGIIRKKANAEHRP
jgi:hypothetical protein